jgi:hypothetical protein
MEIVMEGRKPVSNLSETANPKTGGVSLSAESGSPKQRNNILEALPMRFVTIKINETGTVAATWLTFMVFAAFVFTACGPDRTKSHMGVEMRLLSIARITEYQSGWERAQAQGPDNELAVVQVEFSADGSSKLKLPTSECELRDVGGRTYHTDTDWELTVGGRDNVMVWDFVFALPKTTVLESFRLMSSTFDLGGIRDLEPDARLQPGRHPKQR